MSDPRDLSSAELDEVERLLDVLEALDRVNTTMLMRRTHPICSVLAMRGKHRGRAARRTELVGQSMQYKWRAVLRNAARLRASSTKLRKVFGTLNDLRKKSD